MDINGRDTVGTIRFGRSSTIGLLALAPLDVVVGVILLGVHGGDEVTGLGACVAFTRFADKTPSYCTPFSSIETTSCGSPDSVPTKSEKQSFEVNFHFSAVFFSFAVIAAKFDLPRLNSLNCMPESSASGLHAFRRSLLPL